jgi:hypothetical protein
MTQFNYYVTKILLHIKRKNLKNIAKKIIIHHINTVTVRDLCN